MEAWMWVLAVFVWLVVGFLFGSTFFSGANRESPIPDHHADVPRRHAA